MTVLPMHGQIVLSVSRREDIPAHADRMKWFVNQYRAGVYGNAGCIVFWSKDPKHLLLANGQAACQSTPCYIQFTITGYGKAIERNLRTTEERVQLFENLVNAYGLGHVIWRFDPILMVNGHIGVAETLNRFRALAHQLDGYSERCIFSFLDEYKKLNMLHRLGIRTPDANEREAIVSGMLDINTGLHNPMRLMTCAENGDYAGIEHSSCIDPELVERFSGIPNLGKDPKQRKACGCMKSVDVGEYRKCTHGCIYCYAN